MIRRCTHPQDELLEYIKRDVVNLALGNKDNTALQRDFAGHIALTPSYDFAPRLLHPDGSARRIRWEGNDNGSIDWNRMLDRVCVLAAQVHQEERRKGTTPVQRADLGAGLKNLAPRLSAIANNGAAMDLDAELLNHLRLSIETLAQALDALR